MEKSPIMIEIDLNEYISLMDKKLKLKAFKMALQLKPEPSYNPMGSKLPSSYSCSDFIKNAEAIFKS